MNVKNVLIIDWSKDKNIKLNLNQHKENYMKKFQMITFIVFFFFNCGKSIPLNINQDYTLFEGMVNIQYKLNEISLEENKNYIHIF